MTYRSGVVQSLGNIPLVHPIVIFLDLRSAPNIGPMCLLEISIVFKFDGQTLVI